MNKLPLPPKNLAIADPIRLIIAEGTTLVRRLLMQQLACEVDFRIIAEAENGLQAVNLVTELKPDAILMDIDMPVLDGIQATRQIVALAPSTHVILLTAHKFFVSAGKIFDQMTCIHKDCTPSELISTIRRVVAAPQCTSEEQHNLDTTINRISEQGRLTERESTVLTQILDMNYKSAQIAEELTKLWGQPVTEAAVKHTIERIMNKLQIEPRTRAALMKHVLEYERQCL